MSTNRLSIVHPASGSVCIIGKTMLPYGAGWYVAPNLEERLAEFFDTLDMVDPAGANFFLELQLEEPIRDCAMAVEP